MSNFSDQKKAREIAVTVNSCNHCSFAYGWACMAPWSDLQMEDEFIDPCFEGVYKHLTGESAPALAKYELKRGEYPRYDK